MSDAPRDATNPEGDRHENAPIPLPRAAGRDPGDGRLGGPADDEDAARQQEFLRVSEQLPAKGKWSILLALEQTKTGRWQAYAWSGESRGRPAQQRLWEYDDRVGLRLVDESANEVTE